MPASAEKRDIERAGYGVVMPDDGVKPQPSPRPVRVHPMRNGIDDPAITKLVDESAQLAPRIQELITESSVELLTVMSAVARFESDNRAEFDKVFDEQLGRAIWQGLIADAISLGGRMPSEEEAIAATSSYHARALRETLERHLRIGLCRVLDADLYARALTGEDPVRLTAPIDVGEITTAVQETWEELPDETLEARVRLIRTGINAYVRECLDGPDDDEDVWPEED
jgi:hypothetical protein